MNESKLIRNLEHGGARVLVGGEASEGKLGHSVHHCVHGGVFFHLEAGVDYIPQVTGRDFRERECRQIHLPLLATEIDDLHRGDDLDQHDAEAVDITLVGEMKVLVVLGVQVAWGALWDRGHVRAFGEDRSRQPEIGDFRIKIRV